MMKAVDLTPQERVEALALLHRVYEIINPLISDIQRDYLKQLWHRCAQYKEHTYDRHNISPLIFTLDTAQTFAAEIEADPDILLAILLFEPFYLELVKSDEVQRIFGKDVVEIITGLTKLYEVGLRHRSADKENFRGLLLALANDVRLIIVMIVRSLTLMRRINLHPHTEWVHEVAVDAKTLYAQLAHRLGLYSIKSVLEDLYLKYTDRDTYKLIAKKLNETKRSRDAYIEAFIGPVKERLEAAGLKFSIKGRTKTIASIYNKIVNKKVDMNHIYDLFAIRVILESSDSIERERADCWLGYSILANMYDPDPKRMRDWISYPKANGYESLHITVRGPQDKWVEVQFRTKRMDLVAEKGMAAHWLYKGGKKASTDQWMANVRNVLESASDGVGSMAKMKDMRVEASQTEVYAFTPKGDLLKLPPGSTLLDFAFAVHSNVGCRCTGGIVNGKNQKISYKLQSGDTINVLTSNTQKPTQAWLSLVTTSKARSKIRQTLDEERRAKAELGREMVERRLKNRKIDMDEAFLSRLIFKQGYKIATDFMADVADEKIDLNKFLELCRREQDKEETPIPTTSVAAEEFQLPTTTIAQQDSDTLVIGSDDIHGLKYQFARCCDPHPGDPIFGFISNTGAVKIHRSDCPNAAHLLSRYQYRCIAARWTGDEKSSLQTVRIIGTDDIGIMTNITAIIDKHPDVYLRNVSVNSYEGYFAGILGLRVKDGTTLTSLLAKLSKIPGVKSALKI
jgi:GTP pyrophosphokinase